MVAFLALNGSAILVAFLVARAVAARARASQLALCTLAGLLILIHSTVLAAGLLGWLTAGGMLGVLALPAAGLAWRARWAVPQRTPGEAPSFTPATLIVPFAAIGSGVLWAWPHLAGATRLWIWDDYTYHMVYPTLWLRDQAIAAVTPPQAFTMQAWYPQSANVVAAWFMAPFHGSRGDALAWVSLTGPLYAAIIAAGAAELLARLGCRRGAWAVPVALFATSERTAIMASGFSDADLAQAATLFGALVFAVPRAGAERGHDVAVDTWYGALLSGLAVGVKISAAPPALVIAAMLAWRARVSSGRRRDVARTALVFAAAWTATAAYWYGRSLVHTGNPAYPGRLLGEPGTAFRETTLSEYGRHYGLGRAVSDALAVYLNWPRVHALVAVAGLVGLAWWLGAHHRRMTRPQAFFAVGTLVITAVMALLLPVTPYSAGNAMTFRSGFVHWDSMRYIALLPILGWVALGFLVNAGAGAGPGRTLAAILVTGTALLLSGTAQRAVLVALAALVLSVATAGLRRRGLPAGLRFVACGASRSSLLGRHVGRADPPDAVRLRRIVWIVAVMTVAAVVTATIVAAHRAKAAATAAAIYAEPLFGTAAAVLDRLPAGTRVALFGDQWVYPAFGDRDHLVPVRLDGDGRVATRPIGDAMAPGPLGVDPDTFRANLAASDIDVVVVVHLPHPGRSPEWPPQAPALDAISAARPLYRDGAVGIWTFRPRSRPPARRPEPIEASPAGPA